MPDRRVNRSVLLSIGSHKIHLLPAAVELARHAVLERMIVAGYATARVRRTVAALGLQRWKPIARLLDRGEPDLDESLVCPLWLPELCIQFANPWRGMSRSGSPFQPSINLGMRLYGLQAQRFVKRSQASIYHYRAAYGHHSVKAAKRRGMITLCDHTIAHPSLVEYLVDNGGRFPTPEEEPPLSSFWRMMLPDIDQADHVLTNSDFVRETFLNRGWDAPRVHVAYLGVDDKFLSLIAPRSPASPAVNRPLELMFAGGFDRRKGADVLMDGLRRIPNDNWSMTFAAAGDPGLKARYANVLSSKRIRWLGIIPRSDLAAVMSGIDVFVFPSLAEGSARVVFEALACGCFVITTPNAGSIVQDGVHGLLIKPGDVDDLEKALRKVLAMDRGEIHAIGCRNAESVKQNYRQRHYGHALVGLYERLRTQKQ